MKKVFFLVLFLLFHIGYSQQIAYIQYWFGNDFSGRVLQSVSSNGNNQILFDISFPDNGTNELDTYFHCRFVDSNNNWSAIYSQEMTNTNDASTSLVKVQYWFDADFANKTIADITTVLISNELDHQELDILWPENAQEIHYRFKSSYNKWSSIQSSDVVTTIYQNNEIVAVEYWFDDDFINRLPPQPITANANNQINFDIPFPDNGSNQLDAIVHYRFVDGIGNWSAIYSEQMTNNNQTSASAVELEYWFDDNFSGRLIVPTTQFLNGTQIDHQEASLLWQENAQTIHYRFKSKYNQWSSIQSTNIDEIENRNNKIVEIEYWINDDLASKEVIGVNQNDTVFFDERDINMIINSCNSEIIHLRYKDKMNRYSCIYTFYQDNLNNKPGITVLVHGFQLLGGNIDYEDDFYKMGVDILKRSGGGMIYKNNTSTGALELMPGDYIIDTTKEIVLVYDWKDLSWLTNNQYSGNGNLESAADNMFASFLNLSSVTGISTEQLLSKPKHFIAHSRGTILTLQFLHRLMNYFPDVEVNQFTLLDPHPATTFGDLHSDQINSPLNLPGVEGMATGCEWTFGCETAGEDVVLKIPKNVLRADNYFRTDQQGYEGAGNIGAFDGIAVEGLSCNNRKLNNNVLKDGSPTLLGVPNAHSGVHKWYRGTINLNIDVAEQTLIFSSSTNTNNWYTNGSLNMTNNFLSNETRSTTGFNHSRIGGGTPVALINDLDKINLTEMNIQLRDRYGLSSIEYPNGVSPHTVFGGYFDTNNDAGWSKNGGLSNNVNVENGKAKIPYDSAYPAELKHSLMYFAPNYDFLKINVYDALFCSIKVTFFNHGNVQIGEPLINSLNQANSEQFIPIPNELKGEVGTFQIEYISNNFGSFKVDEIKLVESISTINLKLNIEGYYDTITHQMQPVLLNQGTSTDATLVDNITVELVHPTTLVKVATSVVQLKTNGTAVCNFQSVSAGTYYVVIKHRNAIQTWSATPVTISELPIVYDFSDSANKAYGSNLVELETGVYGLYSGDINQDEVIDASDLPELDTDVENSASGFLTTDLNGDGATDNSDIPFIDNNIMNSIFSIHP